MAIAFDAVSVGLKSPSGTGPLVISHTCTGSDRILFVGCFATAGDVVTGVTYGGVAMTLVAKHVAGSEYEYLYYLIAPATGTNDISISWTGSTILRGHGVSYTGAKQSAQPDAFGTDSETSSNTISTSLTTIADNSWVLMMVRSQGDITAGNNTTLRGVSTTSNILDRGAATTPAGSETLEAIGIASSYAIIASIAPVGSVVTSTVTPQNNLAMLGVS